MPAAGRPAPSVAALAAAGALLLAWLQPARADATREVLSALVGRSKAEVVRRLGPPGDTVTTVDGERLFYETLDAGRIGGRGGGDTRANSPSGIGALRGSYAFRCRTEVVIRDGRVAAFNRSGNDCR